MSPKRRQSGKTSLDAPIATQPKRSRPRSGDARSLANQWSGLRTTILARDKALPPSAVFGASARGGAVYRWGFLSAFGSECEDPLVEQLTRLAGGSKVPRKDRPADGFTEPLLEFQDRVGGGIGVLSDAWEALVWTAAMPRLMDDLGEGRWWDLLGAAQGFRERVLRSSSDPSLRLIAAAELGLTLAWRLNALPSCRRLRKPSLEVLSEWLDDGERSVSFALQTPKQMRLVLASLLRCRMIMRAMDREGELGRSDGWRESDDEPVVELATWVTAMTRRDGSSVFCETQAESWDDGGGDGLLMRAAESEPDALAPAIKSAVGITRTSGRLAWQVSLPESILHDEDAGLACLLPEWDVRRGRMFLSYGQGNSQLELIAGKSVVISGDIETEIIAGGTTLTARGDWVSTCEYTDDDVHYLEIEQPMSAGYVLQRQFMVIREDRCCLFADALVRGTASKRPASEVTEYRMSVPLAGSIDCDCETETSELFLHDEKRLSMVLPLSAHEWRNGGTQTVIGKTSDGRLSITSRGRRQLYVPLWFDFARARFRKKRTWRQLTVAEDLRIVGADAAAAFRVQVGKEQWILYRSMSAAKPRTFFGRQMIADFYVARFDASTESFEDLITVDDE
ncbi:MAG: hypothetical protein AAFU85_18585 [Planctomycetota bacterium]